ncbi:MAG: MarR family winged helix-turn-helix transcriptional regulator [Steroidobacteraceae bacterium]
MEHAGDQACQLASCVRAVSEFHTIRPAVLTSWARMKKHIARDKRTIGRSKRPPRNLNMLVLRQFRVIYGSVRHHFRDVQRACGISGSQLWILHEVTCSTGIGVSELAKRLAIHQSTCSQLVDKLAHAGHVSKRRQSADQRRVELTVTARGRRTLARAPGPVEGVLPEAIAELSTSQQRALHRGLQAVVASLDTKDTEAADQPLSDM